MVRSFHSLFLISASITGVFADFLGPTYPAPKDFTSNTSLVAVAWRNVTSSIGSYLDDTDANSATLSSLKNLTFSLGMFSIHDPAAEALQFHHTSAEVANSTTGVDKVDGNSIYHIASLSKLITSFAGMISLHNDDWSRPITSLIPSLAQIAQNASGEDDPVQNVQWDKVTLAALADQIGGVPRDLLPYSPSDYLLVSTDPVTEYGLPPLDLTELSASIPCAQSLNAYADCSANEYAMAVQGRPPMFLPWASPAYADNGYVLLGVAISKITGKAMNDLYQEAIFGPLRMTSSRSAPPNQTEWKEYVIPGDITNGDLSPELDPAILTPSGGIFSTTNDLAKLGTAILNSTLLPSDQTRKWMKPVSHTALLEYSVGRPWEIYRYTHPISGIVTDLYTKLGDSGDYGSYLVLIPDFDAGFSVIAASTSEERDIVTTTLTDLVIDAILPALMAQAEAESERNFAGTYVSTVQGLNTTLTLALNHSEGAKPGLVVSSFISNDTDVLLTRAIGTSPLRLLPSISNAGTGQIAFRASGSTATAPGLFLNQYYGNFDWIIGDSPTYGGLGLGLFIFDYDLDGKAGAVTPAAWRTKLEKMI